MSACERLRRSRILVCASVVFVLAACGGRESQPSAPDTLPVHLQPAEVKTTFGKRGIQLLRVPSDGSYVWFEGYAPHFDSSAITVLVFPGVRAAENTAAPASLNQRRVRPIRIGNVVLWPDPGFPAGVVERIQTSIRDLREIAGCGPAATASAQPPACSPPRSASG